MFNKMCKCLGSVDIELCTINLQIMLLFVAQVNI